MNSLMKAKFMCPTGRLFRLFAFLENVSSMLLLKLRFVSDDDLEVFGNFIFILWFVMMPKAEGFNSLISSSYLRSEEFYNVI